MILADTSAWVEYDRATGSPVHVRLRGLMATPSLLIVTEPVWTEVLAGAQSSDREDSLRRLLGRFPLVPFETPTDFDGAVRVYRRCRRSGVTPGGLMDCMIATVAQRSGAALLSHDAGLARVARAIGLELDPASLGALS